MIDPLFLLRPLSILNLYNAEGGIQFDFPSEMSRPFKISTDSRTHQQGEVYVSLKGEKFDGDDFVLSVAPQAPLVVIEESKRTRDLISEIQKQKLNTYVLVVQSTLRYLQELSQLHALHWQTQCGGVLIGIAGSNGKTTTKEMLLHVAKTIHGGAGEVIGTQKNNNNHLGVPLTLLQIDHRTTKYAIVEYGSNHPGELPFLCRVAQPQWGITTNIGHTHMEFFKDLPAVMREEASFYFNHIPGNHFLLNLDDEELSKLKVEQWCKTFSSDKAKRKQVDYFYDIADKSVTIRSRAKDLSIENPWVLGHHNFTNLANACVLARECGLGSDQQIAQAAATFRPTTNRSQWLESKFGCKIFLDAYNANPSSMTAALSAFKQHCQTHGDEKLEHSLVILADMRELGPQERDYHIELGQLVRDMGWKHVVYVGEQLSAFQAGFGDKKTLTGGFAQTHEARIYWPKWVKEHSFIFLKGSRLLQLESLVDLG